MRYVIRAHENPCGGVQGGYLNNQIQWVDGGFRSNKWMSVTLSHAFTDINEAYRALENEHLNRSKCKCRFEVEEVAE